MATPSKAKRVIYAGLAGLGITAGAAGISAAATNQPTPSTPSATQVAPSSTDTQESGDTTDAPSYKSSVTVPQTPDASSNGSDNETADAATLAPLAKVTPEQASAAATAKVPGTVGKVQLEDEDGNVVYGVEVTAADGTVTDVKVDAGNATVLAQDSGKESDKESGTEKADTEKADTETTNGAETGDAAGTNAN